MLRFKVADYRKWISVQKSYWVFTTISLFLIGALFGTFVTNKKFNKLTSKRECISEIEEFERIAINLNADNYKQVILPSTAYIEQFCQLEFQRRNLAALYKTTLERLQSYQKIESQMEEMRNKLSHRDSLVADLQKDLRIQNYLDKIYQKLSKTTTCEWVETNNQRSN